MNHAEYLFLHLQVGLVDALRTQVELEGEVFHPVPVYTRLRSGLEGRAERVGTEMRLYLRHPAGQSEPPDITSAFQAFFPKGFQREDVEKNDMWVVYSARGPDVLTPFTEGANTPETTPTSSR